MRKKPPPRPITKGRNITSAPRAAKSPLTRTRRNTWQRSKADERLTLIEKNLPPDNEVERIMKIGQDTIINGKYAISQV